MDINLLYSCNEWKERKSYSLVMASTSPTKIKKEVIRQVKLKCMSLDYTGEPIMKLPLEDINRNLEHGDIITVKDGERQ